MLSLTQPSTSESPPATTDPLHHAVEELLVELRRDRAEVADEADGAGEGPRLREGADFRRSNGTARLPLSRSIGYALQRITPVS